MIDKNVTVGDDFQYFEAPGKKNHCDTAPTPQVLLGYDSLQCLHNNTTDKTDQKLNPSGKEYLCFKTDGKKFRASQLSK